MQGPCTPQPWASNGEEAVAGLLAVAAQGRNTPSGGCTKCFGGGGSSCL